MDGQDKGGSKNNALDSVHLVEKFRNLALQGRPLWAPGLCR